MYCKQNAYTSKLLETKNVLSQSYSRTGVAAKKTISKQDYLKPYFDYEFSEDQSSRIALDIERCIKNTRNLQKETPYFAQLVLNRILYLHGYNLKVAEVSFKYPLSENLTLVLIRYIILECKILYKKEYYSTSKEILTEKRIVRLLLNIYSSYFESLKNIPPKKLLKECCMTALKLLMRIKSEFDVRNDLMENIAKKLVAKMGGLEQINALKQKCIPCPLDTYLSDPAPIDSCRRLITSDYGTEMDLDMADDISKVHIENEEYTCPNLEMDIKQDISDLMQMSKRLCKSSLMNSSNKKIPMICIDTEDKEVTVFERELQVGTISEYKEQRRETELKRFKEQQRLLFSNHKPFKLDDIKVEVKEEVVEFNSDDKLSAPESSNSCVLYNVNRNINSLFCLTNTNEEILEISSDEEDLSIKIGTNRGNEPVEDGSNKIIETGSCISNDDRSVKEEVIEVSNLKPSDATPQKIGDAFKISSNISNEITPEKEEELLGDDTVNLSMSVTPEMEEELLRDDTTQTTSVRNIDLASKGNLHHGDITLEKEEKLLNGEAIPDIPVQSCNSNKDAGYMTLETKKELCEKMKKDEIVPVESAQDINKAIIKKDNLASAKTDITTEKKNEISQHENNEVVPTVSTVADKEALTIRSGKTSETAPTIEEDLDRTNLIVEEKKTAEAERTCRNNITCGKEEKLLEAEGNVVTVTENVSLLPDDHEKDDTVIQDINDSDIEELAKSEVIESNTTECSEGKLEENKGNSSKLIDTKVGHCSMEIEEDTVCNIAPVKDEATTVKENLGVTLEEGGAINKEDNKSSNLTPTKELLRDEHKDTAHVVSLIKNIKLSGTLENENVEAEDGVRDAVNLSTSLGSNNFETEDDLCNSKETDTAETEETHEVHYKLYDTEGLKSMSVEEECVFESTKSKDISETIEQLHTVLVSEPIPVDTSSKLDKTENLTRAESVANTKTVDSIHVEPEDVRTNVIECDEGNEGSEKQLDENKENSSKSKNQSIDIEVKHCSIETETDTVDLQVETTNPQDFNNPSVSTVQDECFTSSQINKIEVIAPESNMEKDKALVQDENSDEIIPITLTKFTTVPVTNNLGSDDTTRKVDTRTEECIVNSGKDAGAVEEDLGGSNQTAKRDEPTIEENQNSSDIAPGKGEATVTEDIDVTDEEMYSSNASTEKEETLLRNEHKDTVHVAALRENTNLLLDTLENENIVPIPPVENENSNNIIPKNEEILVEDEIKNTVNISMSLPNNNMTDDLHNSKITSNPAEALDETHEHNSLKTAPVEKELVKDVSENRAIKSILETMEQSYNVVSELVLVDSSSKLDKTENLAKAESVPIPTKCNERNADSEEDLEENKENSSEFKKLVDIEIGHSSIEIEKDIVNLQIETANPHGTSVSSVQDQYFESFQLNEIESNTDNLGNNDKTLTTENMGTVEKEETPMDSCNIALGKEDLDTRHTTNEKEEELLRVEHEDTVRALALTENISLLPDTLESIDPIASVVTEEISYARENKKILPEDDIKDAVNLSTLVGDRDLVADDYVDNEGIIEKELIKNIVENIANADISETTNTTECGEETEDRAVPLEENKGRNIDVIDLQVGIKNGQNIENEKKGALISSIQDDYSEGLQINKVELTVAKSGMELLQDENSERIVDTLKTARMTVENNFGKEDATSKKGDNKIEEQFVNTNIIENEEIITEDNLDTGDIVRGKEEEEVTVEEDLSKSNVTLESKEEREHKDIVNVTVLTENTNLLENKSEGDRVAAKSLGNSNLTTEDVLYKKSEEIKITPVEEKIMVKVDIPEATEQLHHVVPECISANNSTTTDDLVETEPLTNTDRKIIKLKGIQNTCEFIEENVENEFKKPSIDVEYANSIELSHLIQFENIDVNEIEVNTADSQVEIDNCVNERVKSSTPAAESITEVAHQDVETDCLENSTDNFMEDEITLKPPLKSVPDVDIITKTVTTNETSRDDMILEQTFGEDLDVTKQLEGNDDAVLHLDNESSEVEVKMESNLKGENNQLHQYKEVRNAVNLDGVQQLGSYSNMSVDDKTSKINLKNGICNIEFEKNSAGLTDTDSKGTYEIEENIPAKLVPCENSEIDKLEVITTESYQEPKNASSTEMVTEEQCQCDNKDSKVSICTEKEKNVGQFETTVSDRGLDDSLTSVKTQELQEESDLLGKIDQVIVKPSEVSIGKDSYEDVETEGIMETEPGVKSIHTKSNEDTAQNIYSEYQQAESTDEYVANTNAQECLDDQIPVDNSEVHIEECEITSNNIVEMEENFEEEILQFENTEINEIEVVTTDPNLEDVDEFNEIIEEENGGHTDRLISETKSNLSRNAKEKDVLSTISNSDMKEIVDEKSKDLILATVTPTQTQTSNASYNSSRNIYNKSLQNNSANLSKQVCLPSVSALTNCNNITPKGSIKKRRKSKTKPNILRRKVNNSSVNKHQPAKPEISSHSPDPLLMKIDALKKIGTDVTVKNDHSIPNQIVENLNICDNTNKNASLNMLATVALEYSRQEKDSDDTTYLKGKSEVDVTLLPKEKSKKTTQHIENVKSKRVTRSSKSKKKTVAKCEPHDFIIFGTSPPSNKEYTQKLHEPYLSCEENDSEGNLVIDDDTDTKSTMYLKETPMYAPDDLFHLKEDTMDENIILVSNVTKTEDVSINILGNSHVNFDYSTKIEKFDEFYCGDNSVRLVNGEKYAICKSNTAVTKYPVLMKRPFRTKAEQKDYDKFSLKAYVSVERVDTCSKKDEEDSTHIKSNSYDTVLNSNLGNKFMDLFHSSLHPEKPDDASIKNELIVTPQTECKDFGSVNQSVLELQSVLIKDSLSQGVNVKDCVETTDALKEHATDLSDDDVPLLQRTQPKRKIRKSKSRSKTVTASIKEENVNESISEEHVTKNITPEPLVTLSDLTVNGIVDSSLSTTNSTDQGVYPLDLSVETNCIKNEHTTQRNKNMKKTPFLPTAGEEYRIHPKLRRKSVMENELPTSNTSFNKIKPKQIESVATSKVDILANCKNTVSPTVETLKRKLGIDSQLNGIDLSVAGSRTMATEESSSINIAGVEINLDKDACANRNNQKKSDEIESEIKPNKNEDKLNNVCTIEEIVHITCSQFPSLHVKDQPINCASTNTDKECVAEICKNKGNITTDGSDTGRDATDEADNLDNLPLSERTAILSKSKSVNTEVKSKSRKKNTKHSNIEAARISKQSKSNHILQKKSVKEKTVNSANLVKDFNALKKFKKVQENSCAKGRIIKNEVKSKVTGTTGQLKPKNPKKMRKTVSFKKDKTCIETNIKLEDNYANYVHKISKVKNKNDKKSQSKSNCVKIEPQNEVTSTPGIVNPERYGSIVEKSPTDEKHEIDENKALPEVSKLANDVDGQIVGTVTGENYQFVSTDQIAEADAIPLTCQEPFSLEKLDVTPEVGVIVEIPISSSPEETDIDSQIGDLPSETISETGSTNIERIDNSVEVEVKNSDFNSNNISNKLVKVESGDGNHELYPQTELNSSIEQVEASYLDKKDLENEINVQPEQVEVDITPRLNEQDSTEMLNLQTEVARESNFDIPVVESEEVKGDKTACTEITENDELNDIAKLQAIVQRSNEDQSVVLDLKTSIKQYKEAMPDTKTENVPVEDTLREIPVTSNRKRKCSDEYTVHDEKKSKPLEIKVEVKSVSNPQSTIIETSKPVSPTQPKKKSKKSIMSVINQLKEEKINSLESKGELTKLNLMSVAVDVNKMKTKLSDKIRSHSISKVKLEPLVQKCKTPFIKDEKSSNVNTEIKCRYVKKELTNDLDNVKGLFSKVRDRKDLDIYEKIETKNKNIKVKPELSLHTNSIIENSTTVESDPIVTSSEPRCNFVKKEIPEKLEPSQKYEDNTLNSVTQGSSTNYANLDNASTLLISAAKVATVKNIITNTSEHFHADARESGIGEMDITKTGDCAFEDVKECSPTQQKDNDNTLDIPSIPVAIQNLTTEDVNTSNILEKEATNENTISQNLKNIPDVSEICDNYCANSAITESISVEPSTTKNLIIEDANKSNFSEKETTKEDAISQNLENMQEVSEICDSYCMNAAITKTIPIEPSTIQNLTTGGVNTNDIPYSDIPSEALEKETANQVDVLQNIVEVPNVSEFCGIIQHEKSELVEDKLTNGVDSPFKFNGPEEQLNMSMKEELIECRNSLDIKVSTEEIVTSSWGNLSITKEIGDSNITENLSNFGSNAKEEALETYMPTSLTNFENVPSVTSLHKDIFEPSCISASETKSENYMLPNASTNTLPIAETLVKNLDDDIVTSQNLPKKLFSTTFVEMTPDNGLIDNSCMDDFSSANIDDANLFNLMSSDMTNKLPCITTTDSMKFFPFPITSQAHIKSCMLSTTEVHTNKTIPPSNESENCIFSFNDQINAGNSERISSDVALNLQDVSFNKLAIDSAQTFNISTNSVIQTLSDGNYMNEVPVNQVRDIDHNYTMGLGGPMLSGSAEEKNVFTTTYNEQLTDPSDQLTDPSDHLTDPSDQLTELSDFPEPEDILKGAMDYAVEQLVMLGDQNVSLSLDIQKMDLIEPSTSNSEENSNSLDSGLISSIKQDSNIDQILDNTTAWAQFIANENPKQKVVVLMNDPCFIPSFTINRSNFIESLEGPILEIPSINSDLNDILADTENKSVPVNQDSLANTSNFIVEDTSVKKLPNEPGVPKFNSKNNKTLEKTTPKSTSVEDDSPKRTYSKTVFRPKRRSYGTEVITLKTVLPHSGNEKPPNASLQTSLIKNRTDVINSYSNIFQKINMFENRQKQQTSTISPVDTKSVKELDQPLPTSITSVDKQSKDILKTKEVGNSPKIPDSVPNKIVGVHCGIADNVKLRKRAATNKQSNNFNSPNLRETRSDSSRSSPISAENLPKMSQPEVKANVELLHGRKSDRIQKSPASNIQDRPAKIDTPKPYIKEVDTEPILDDKLNKSCLGTDKPKLRSNVAISEPCPSSNNSSSSSKCNYSIDSILSNAPKINPVSTNDKPSTSRAAKRTFFDTKTDDVIPRKQHKSSPCEAPLLDSNDRTFNTLFQQGNVNKSITLIVTEDNKLKTEVKKDKLDEIKLNPKMRRRDSPLTKLNIKKSEVDKLKTERRNSPLRPAIKNEEAVNLRVGSNSQLNSHSSAGKQQDESYARNSHHPHPIYNRSKDSSKDNPDYSNVHPSSRTREGHHLHQTRERQGYHGQSYNNSGRRGYHPEDLKRNYSRHNGAGRSSNLLYSNLGRSSNLPGSYYKSRPSSNTTVPQSQDQSSHSGSRNSSGSFMKKDVKLPPHKVNERLNEAPNKKGATSSKTVSPKEDYAWWDNFTPYFPSNPSAQFNPQTSSSSNSRK